MIPGQTAIDDPVEPATPAPAPAQAAPVEEPVPAPLVDGPRLLEAMLTAPRDRRRGGIPFVVNLPVELSDAIAAFVAEHRVTRKDLATRLLDELLASFEGRKP